MKECDSHRTERSLELLPRHAARAQNHRTRVVHAADDGGLDADACAVQCALCVERYGLRVAEWIECIRVCASG